MHFNKAIAEKYQVKRIIQSVKHFFFFKKSVLVELSFPLEVMTL